MRAPGLKLVTAGSNFMAARLLSTSVPRPALPQRVTSEALLGAARSLVIVHNGREYRLTVTQNGKLILTA